MKKTFKYGDRVRVKLPGKRAFFGRVYSEYHQRPAMRRICVEHKNGLGVGYPVCFVTAVRS